MITVIIWNWGIHHFQPHFRLFAGDILGIQVKTTTSKSQWSYKAQVEIGNCFSWLMKKITPLQSLLSILDNWEYCCLCHPICANRCKSKSLLIDRFVFFLFVLKPIGELWMYEFYAPIDKTKHRSDTETSKISWVDTRIITNHKSINVYIYIYTYTVYICIYIMIIHHLPSVNSITLSNLLFLHGEGPCLL